MRKSTLILSLVAAFFLSACGGGSDTIAPQKVSVHLKKEAVAQYTGHGGQYWQRLYLPLAEIIVSPAVSVCKSLDIAVEGTYVAVPNIFIANNDKDITGEKNPIMGGIRVNFSSPVDIGNGSTISVFVNMPNSLASEQYLFKAKSFDCGTITIDGLPVSLGLITTTSYSGPPPKI